MNSIETFIPSYFVKSFPFQNNCPSKEVLFVCMKIVEMILFGQLEYNS
jgi:hypothetical protein